MFGEAMHRKEVGGEGHKVGAARCAAGGLDVPLGRSWAATAAVASLRKQKGS